MLAGDMHMYGDSDSDSDRVRCFTCLASTSASESRDSAEEERPVTCFYCPHCVRLLQSSINGPSRHCRHKTTTNMEGAT